MKNEQPSRHPQSAAEFESIKCKKRGNHCDGSEAKKIWIFLICENINSFWLCFAYPLTAFRSRLPLHQQSFCGERNFHFKFHYLYNPPSKSSRQVLLLSPLRCTLWTETVKWTLIKNVLLNISTEEIEIIRNEKNSKRSWMKVGRNFLKAFPLPSETEISCVNIQFRARASLSPPHREKASKTSKERIKFTVENFIK